MDDEGVEEEVVELERELGEEKNPAGQDGPAIHAPLSESCDVDEQAVQYDGVPEQVEQEESQAETKVFQLRFRSQ